MTEYLCHVTMGLTEAVLVPRDGVDRDAMDYLEPILAAGGGNAAGIGLLHPGRPAGGFIRCLLERSTEPGRLGQPW
jgi:hypothetical protein